MAIRRLKELRTLNIVNYQYVIKGISFLATNSIPFLLALITKVKLDDV